MDYSERVENKSCIVEVLTYIYCRFWAPKIMWNGCILL